ncbi:MAG: prolyl oligopeptidase family serine peptidase, partial [Clostridia bacterium]|nr:prolyl oligopeptidase family serine peptidase [Clostridia bacterium]
MKAVVDIVKQLSENYAVDTDRIYAAGLSMGGYGTWDLMVRHNDIFAAAIAICGGGDASKADLLKYTPLFVFHGSADPTVPVTGSQNVVNAIKNLGGTLVEYTEFAGLGHGAWNPAFETVGLLDKLLACKL